MRTLTPQLVRCFSAIADHRSDGDLLAGFLERRAEDDFVQLVHKYGPMVWGVCRRALPDAADAEDAFQTVFLVLVRRGHRLVNMPSIGPWLHRVAVWTARNARRRNARQLAHRVAFPEMISAPGADADLTFDLDSALLSLPEKLRSSIVLCHVLGYSRADAAAQLGCAERTLKLWLARGLEKLRGKLNGLNPVRPLALAAVTVPLALSETLVRAAISWQSAVLTTSLISTTVSTLVHGVMRMFWIKKATAASLALFTVFAFGVGVGVSTHQSSPAVAGDDPAKTPMQEGKAAQIQRQGQGAIEIDMETAVLERTLAEALDHAKQLRVDAQKLDEELKRELKDVSKEELLNPDSEMLKKLRARQYKLRLTEQQALESEKFVDGLKQKLRALRDAQKQDPPKKAPPEKPAAKAPPTTERDLAKRLAAMQLELAALQLKAELEKAQSLEVQLKRQSLLEAMLRTQAEIQALKSQQEKEKIPQAKPPSSAGYLQLTINQKGAEWPFKILEVGPNGKQVGEAAFQNAEVLGLYLSRTMKDSSGPKELRIFSRADSPTNLIHAAVKAGKDAGYGEIPGHKAIALDKSTEERLRVDLRELLEGNYEGKKEIEQLLQLEDGARKAQEVLRRKYTKEQRDRERSFFEDLEAQKNQDAGGALLQNLKQLDSQQKPVDPTKLPVKP